MAAEFERFSVARFRILIGLLEVAGGLGVVFSFLYPPLMILSASGLFLLMVSVVIMRLRLKDPLVELVPALVLALITAYLVLAR